MESTSELILLEVIESINFVWSSRNLAGRRELPPEKPGPICLDSRVSKKVMKAGDASVFGSVYGGVLAAFVAQAHARTEPYTQVVPRLVAFGWAFFSGRRTARVFLPQPQ